jgi:hypothetical protein
VTWRDRILHHLDEVGEAKDASTIAFPEGWSTARTQTLLEALWVEGLVDGYPDGPWRRHRTREEQLELGL